MKLIDLIDHLKTAVTTEAFTSKEIPDIEYGQVDIYMKDRLDADSEIAFFDMDATPDTVTMELDGIKYENLFPLAMLQDLVEEYAEVFGPNGTNEQIVKRVMEYRENDV